MPNVKELGVPVAGASGKASSEGMGIDFLRCMAAQTGGCRNLVVGMSTETSVEASGPDPGNPLDDMRGLGMHKAVP